ncbi:MAG TPA: hypothetical protein VMW17_06930 [Candidatus Binatia bacterium]|nr:hypothetical protein [Candidatus Binatia bacterium]
MTGRTPKFAVGGVDRPEQRLLLAVLEEAIMCFQKYLHATDAEGRRAFRDAEDWIMEANRCDVFSFHHVCEVAGMDPAYVRRGLQQWRLRRATGYSGAAADVVRAGAGRRSDRRSL